MGVTATSLPGVNFDTVTSRDEGRTAVESMCNDAVTGMHECCSSVAFDQLMCQCFPNKVVTRHSADKPWVTDGFRALVRKRQRAHYVWRSCAS